ncbi:hypothetical protein [Mesorhizobium sp. M7A.F.Ca.CA.004.12.1.1]|uniref:hypothetical protein n=1 Tax=Mesorhizobium sp. M7A.F.Ca.CA.004.12.1.1 TaxID=2496732 RepID=UPI001FE22114|nr:hypothetical protein [Mesorhizobium sp. M7A.F.Ca.CA.004.12.1.1]
MNPILSVEGVTAGYGRVTVLHDISLEAGRFGNVGLFGPNGHGKTTLRMGFTPPISWCRDRLR